MPLSLPLLPHTRAGRIRLVILAGFLPALFLLIWMFTFRMPGQVFAGPFPAMTPAQDSLRTALERHVRALAGEIGERSAARPAALERAAAYLKGALAALGYRVQVQEFAADDRTFTNLEVILPGTAQPDEIVVVGGHYDTAEGTPGADDNASGAAGIVELARLLAGDRWARTVRFVLFANEEPPYFATDNMGSRHYARRAREQGERIVAMLSLESIGYYAPEPGTQRYPFPLSLMYPDRGDFIGFVGNLRSGPLTRRAIEIFRKHTPFPTQGAATPWWVPGVFWSDHWSFWREGYAAILISDTAPYRNPFYHGPLDTPDQLDYPRMARVVDGLAHVVRELAAR